MGQSRVFGLVIKLLQIDGTGRVLLLPRDRSPDCLFDVDWFLIAQFNSNARRRGSQMLRHIARRQQMFWRSLSRQYNKSPRPVYLSCDPGLPFQLRNRRLFADVVNTSRRLLRGSRERDRIGHVVHVSARRPPSGKIIGNQDCTSSIRAAFDQWKPSMQPISRPRKRETWFAVLRRKTETGAGEAQDVAGADFQFHQDRHPHASGTGRGQVQPIARRHL
jgi:hypothetical protein